MSEKAAKKPRAKPAPKKAKAVAKKEDVKPEPVPAVNMGPSPYARVVARHGELGRERRAKGFSFGELSAAGLNYTVARSLSVPVDLRRRSTLDWNVGALKGWYRPAPKTEEPKPEKEKAVKPTKKKAAKKAKKPKKE